MSKFFFHIFVLMILILMIFGCGGGGGESAVGDSPIQSWSGVFGPSGSYVLEKIMSTSFGLPKQISMLPRNRIVLTDPNNNQIVMIDGNETVVLIKDDNLFAHAAIASPNGLVYCSDLNGNVWNINPDTMVKSLACQLPIGVGVCFE